MKCQCPKKKNWPIHRYFHHPIRLIWNNGTLLFLANGILALLSYSVHHYHSSSLHQSEKSELFPQRKETVGFQQSIDAAIEIFDFMIGQKAGTIPVKSLDSLPRDIRQIWCWKKPTRPPTILPNDHQEKDQWTSITSAGRRPETNDAEMYIWKAYWDGRDSEAYPTASGAVQLLVMVRRQIVGKLFCIAWFDDSSYTQIETMYREIWQRAWDPRNKFYTPWIVTCPIPKSYASRVPSHISLIDKECDANAGHNLVPVFRHNRHKDSSAAQTVPQAPSSNPKDTNKVVVCVKGMDFTDDNSQKLIEWIEFQYLLGADHITLYTYSVHPNTSDVLRHYVNRGILTQVKLSLPGSAPTAPYFRSRYIWRNRQQKRRNEIIPYNDCLYRHLETHKYLLIIDTDEVVVPMPPHQKWTHILTELEDTVGDWAAYSIPNLFFFPNLTRNPDPSLPDRYEMMRHNFRSKSISPAGSYGKSFVRIQLTSTVFNHFPLHKHRKAVRRTHYVPHTLARKFHFKSTCPIESRDECPGLYRNTVRDNSLLKYRDVIVRRVEKSLEDIQNGKKLQASAQSTSTPKIE